jgi:hypothetical protein
LYNSDLLMYDRRPGHVNESLWCQLQARAVAGPAASRGDSLRIIPCQLARWEDWKALRPSTTVLARDPARAERYRREPYTSYFGSDVLKYPVAPLPEEGSLPLKTPCVILGRPGAWTVVPLPVAGARSAGQAMGEQAARDNTPRGSTSSAPPSAGGWTLDAAGHRVELTYHDKPPTVAIVVSGTGPAQPSGDPGRPDLQVLHAFWFAWYATHPGAVALR